METTKTTSTVEIPPVKKVVPPWRKGTVQLAALVLVLLVGGYFYVSRNHESTDDAYVGGHLHSVSSRVAGVVQQVLVDDNQTVQAGEVLVKLDPADLQISYNEAKANFEKAQLDFQRNQELEGTKAVTQQDIDHAHTDLDSMRSRMEEARLQLDYTTIVAPAEGKIGKKNVEVGNRVQPGQTLLSVVGKEVWVWANFKETQLARMQAHQKVRMTIDAIPGKTFLGTIDSLSPASGNEFALLPADNSTGNFTKIVQRVPVKISFDPASIQSFADRIRPGLSVVVTVEVAP